MITSEKTDEDDEVLPRQLLDVDSASDSSKSSDSIPDSSLLTKSVDDPPIVVVVVTTPLD